MICGSEEKMSSQSETLSLPWVGKESSRVFEIQNPTVIETSKWTKAMMVKACNAIGVNITGFEHEILDMILRMEHKRQLQLNKQKSKGGSAKSLEEKVNSS